MTGKSIPMSSSIIFHVQRALSKTAESFSNSLLSEAKDLLGSMLDTLFWQRSESHQLHKFMLHIGFPFLRNGLYKHSDEWIKIVRSSSKGWAV